MNFKNTFILIAVALLTLAGLFAGLYLLQTPDTPTEPSAMNAANQLYRAGHYNEAGQIYEQLLAQGARSSILFYNLGNIYYQQDDLGRAILNYQRAAQLAPRDRDIQANLALARSQAVDVYPQVPLGPIDTLAKLTSTWLTLNEIAILALSAWFMFGLLGLAWYFSKPGNTKAGFSYAMILILFLVVLAGFSLGSRMYLEQAQPNGVIIDPVIVLSSDPGVEHSTEIELHSGTEVNLFETEGNWIRLSVPGDTVQGWIPLESVELIAYADQESVT